MTLEPQWHVDCSANPYDIRPAVKAIMDAENWILSRIPPEQKLVVIVGECHSYQTHSLILQALLNAHLKQPHAFSLGYEWEHTYLNEWTEQKEDVLGSESLKTFIRHEFESEAEKAIFKNCLQHKISAKFNDIASYSEEEGNYYIEKYDLFSRNIIDRYMPHLSKKRKIFRCSLSDNDSDGIALSNYCIREQAIMHIEETGSRIYLQHCGGSHVAGDYTDKRRIYNYKTSMSCLFQERGYAVLPVFLDFEEFTSDEKEIPDSIHKMSIKIKNLAPGKSSLHFYDRIRDRVNAASEMNLI